ncbi:PREDICTED: protein FAM47E [Colobus angolensis palliatus]|uniref:protein FAM47E n=1 Tax=Colobus angolensis palliatus TaxID=336983 RepID=UPI0005F540E6|nr:PREDICTED: protein FAM47E [Colobus angolensis palliatus]
MGDRRRRLQPGTLAPVREGVNYRSGCFRKHKNALKFPTSLNSWQLVFLRKRLDDFRKGCPSCTGLVTQVPVEGFLPQIYRRAPQLAPKKRQIKLPKEADLLSKLSPAQQARKAFLEDVEAHLTPHPLALYPNLEEAMPVELLLKVLEVLDPDRKLEDTWAYCQDTRKGMKEPTKLFKKRSTQVYLGPGEECPGLALQGTGWKSLPVSGCQLASPLGPKAMSSIMAAVSSEGDILAIVFALHIVFQGISDIDEEFILKQFDIDYETKPSHDALHTMKPNQVALELKHSVGLSKLQEPKFFQKPGYERKLQKPQNPCKPKWVKMRYGAWYLNPKLWKKQRADEPLVDPEVSHKAQEENFKKELQEQEELLADLHGTVAFKDFILSRGYRMPRFLENMYIGKECKRACNKTPIK